MWKEVELERMTEILLGFPKLIKHKMQYIAKTKGEET